MMQWERKKVDEAYNALKKEVDYWQEQTKAAREKTDNAVKKTVKQVLREVIKRLDEYRLENEWNESKYKWRLDSSVFVIEVLSDGGLIDGIAKDFGVDLDDFPDCETYKSEEDCKTCINYKQCKGAEQ